MNLIFFAQKSDPPVLDNLMNVPFESELRRASAQKTLATPKQQQVLTELGTSVAPRQRPKGNVSSQNNLPLVLPSSPSPRNTIASPSLQGLQNNNDANFDATDKSNSISQISTPASPYAIKTRGPNPLLQNDLKSPTSANENIFETGGSKTDISSPTSPIHQNTPKVLASGHRRNMSDTSAFNKYILSFKLYFQIKISLRFVH